MCESLNKCLQVSLPLGSPQSHRRGSSRDPSNHVVKKKKKNNPHFTKDRSEAREVL